MLISSPLHHLQSLPSDHYYVPENIRKVLGFLRSLYNNDSTKNKPIATASQAVFIVHGHDDSLISEVKVCYTPCDVGRAIAGSSDEKRARQNVVYEHGLFQGFLGRKRIITLLKGGTNLPGDLSGVVYTSVDDDGWQSKLVEEIRAIDK